MMGSNSLQVGPSWLQVGSSWSSVGSLQPTQTKKIHRANGLLNNLHKVEALLSTQIIFILCSDGQLCCTQCLKKQQDPPLHQKMLSWVFRGCICTTMGSSLRTPETYVSSVLRYNSIIEWRAIAETCRFELENCQTLYIILRLTSIDIHT